MKIIEKTAIAIVIIIVGSLTIFFGMQKVNYYSDEVWTYGLANSTSGIYPKIEMGVEYSGYGPLDNFVKAKDGARFNAINVLKNQADDVHPPLYYMLINFVCSIFADTYSKWYGIAINIAWMIPILLFLYKLTKLITNNMVASLGIIIVYGLSVIFLDSLIFIRMYVQFTFFTVALSYLIKKYWDKNIDKKFCIRLSLILMAGMLTHYYFLIFIFAISLSFGMRLHAAKRNDELKK